jgi:hypothetical protein
MSKVKFELNLPGLNELMKSPEMCAILEESGSTVAMTAGAGYASRVHQASFVAIANVYPDTAQAAKDNYDNNSLLKALGASGLKMGK